jgi:hypothetical protein
VWGHDGGLGIGIALAFDRRSFTKEAITVRYCALPKSTHNDMYTIEKQNTMDRLEEANTAEILCVLTSGQTRRLSILLTRGSIFVHIDPHVSKQTQDCDTEAQSPLVGDTKSRG